MKKFLSVLLSATLLASALAGCSGASAAAGSSGSSSEAASAPGSSSAAGAASSSGKHSKLLQKCLDQGYITIGTGNDIPFAFMDESTGEAKGIEVDITKEALSRLGVKNIKWKVMDWTVLLQELQKKTTIDMVADGLFIKPERQKIVDFTNALYLQGEALIVAKDSKINSKADLKGKNVGTVTGWVYDSELDGWVKNGDIAKKTMFSGETDAILALTQGSIDGALVDSAGAAYILKKNPDSGFRIVSDYKPEASGLTASAVAFGNSDFLKEYNTVIDAMKTDGTMAKIIDSWGLPKSFNLMPVDQYQTKNSGT
jgi:polar amino acid transport system substrate-binding protein